MTKCITLKNEAVKDVAKGIFHNVNLDLIINIDNQSFGDNHIAIQIAESLSK